MSFVDFVLTDIKPDMVIWTGDNSPHYVWADTEEDVIASTVGLTQILKDSFTKKGITVVPIQGNHDTWPINYQDFTYAGVNNAIQAIADAWVGWLEPDTLKIYREFGYYS
jgi:sphingomyelin phosphodiesterase